MIPKHLFYISWTLLYNLGIMMSPRLMISDHWAQNHNSYFSPQHCNQFKKKQNAQIKQKRSFLCCSLLLPGKRFKKNKRFALLVFSKTKTLTGPGGMQLRFLHSTYMQKLCGGRQIFESESTKLLRECEP